MLSAGGAGRTDPATGHRRARPALRRRSVSVAASLVAAMALTSTASTATPAGAVPSQVAPAGTPSSARLAAELAGRPEVGFGRWRDLHAGMTLRQARRTGKIKHVDTCGPWVLRRPWSRWAYASLYDGRLHSIAVFGADERTATGAGRGSTLQTLQDQYPDLSPVRHWGEEGDGIDYVFVRRDEGTITFQFRYGAQADEQSRVVLLMVTKRRPGVFWEGC